MAAVGYLAWCEDSAPDTTDEINWAALGRFPAARELRAQGSPRSSRVSSSSAGALLSSDRFYAGRDIDFDTIDNDIQRLSISSPRSPRRPSTSYLGGIRESDEISVFSSGQRRKAHSNRSPKSPVDKSASSTTTKSHKHRRSSNTSGPIVSSLAANVVSTTNSIFASQVGQARTRSRHASMSSTDTTSSESSAVIAPVSSAVPALPRRATARDQRR